MEKHLGNLIEEVAVESPETIGDSRRNMGKKAMKYERGIIV